MTQISVTRIPGARAQIVVQALGVTGSFHRIELGKRRTSGSDFRIEECLRPRPERPAEPVETVSGDQHDLSPDDMKEFPEELHRGCAPCSEGTSSMWGKYS